MNMVTEVKIVNYRCFDDSIGFFSKRPNFTFKTWKKLPLYGTHMFRRVLMSESFMTWRLFRT